MRDELSPVIRAMRIALGLFSCIFLAGFTTLVPWDPTYKGAEMTGSVSLNIEDVAIKVSEFGFMNSSYGPRAYLSIRNFTNHTIQYDPRSCRLFANGHSVEPTAAEPKLEIPPRQKRRITVTFKFNLEEEKLFNSRDGECYIPSPSEVSLLLGKIVIGGREILLPSIDYVYPYTNCAHKKFL